MKQYLTWTQITRDQLYTLLVQNFVFTLTRGDVEYRDGITLNGWYLLVREHRNLRQQTLAFIPVRPDYIATYVGHPSVKESEFQTEAMRLLRGLGYVDASTEIALTAKFAPPSYIAPELIESHMPSATANDDLCLRTLSGNAFYDIDYKLVLLLPNVQEIDPHTLCLDVEPEYILIRRKDTKEYIGALHWGLYIQRDEQIVESYVPHIKQLTLRASVTVEVEVSEDPEQLEAVVNFQEFGFQTTFGGPFINDVHVLEFTRIGVRKVDNPNSESDHDEAEINATV